MAAHAPVVGAVTEISRTPVHRTGSSKIMGIPVVVALHSPIGAVAAVQVTAVDAPKHVNRFSQVGAARKRRITVKNAGLHEHIIPPGGVPGGHPPAPESPRKVNRVKEIRAREIIVIPGPRPADDGFLVGSTKTHGICVPLRNVPHPTHPLYNGRKDALPHLPLLDQVRLIRVELAFLSGTQGLIRFFLGELQVPVGTCIG